MELKPLKVERVPEKLLRLNRTNVELKHGQQRTILRAQLGLNRTNVELKQPVGGWLGLTYAQS